MALIDTFAGSVALGCMGGFMIYASKPALRNAVKFYRELLNRDPVRTTSFDLLLAFLHAPRGNPVVFAIMLWLGGWFFALLGFLMAFVRFHEL